ncbi:unnamed protein product [Adineta ricciae]|uniref:Uncharacterized protein n=1 Tax=Adineta ricciae TaxID=249248 RepID=A0A815FGP9_ADIRI|nr:unnamed protein product [Adineta ricciae]
MFFATFDIFLEIVTINIECYLAQIVTTTILEVRNAFIQLHRHLSHPIICSVWCIKRHRQTLSQYKQSLQSVRLTIISKSSAPQRHMQLVLT